MKRYLLIFITFFLSMTVFADDANWVVLPKESKISFAAVQNSAPVTGEFKVFSAEINFDPEKLATSHVSILIDMDSVSASYIEVANTLKTDNWFNTKEFPQAGFKATHFVKTGNNTYQADGVLTIRDKTQPVVVNFVLEDYSKTMARVTGHTEFKRTLFGVGQGDFAKTDIVKDEVSVSFVLTAVKK